MEQSRSKARRIAIQKGETFPEMDIKEIDRVVAHLVKELGQAKSHIKELEERQKWIDEVGRPGHPDDERPWCSAYLDCRARIKELEEGLRVKQICPACWNNLEQDGSCLTCRLEKRVRELEAELSKWTAPHEDSELQEMKEQADQSSLGAKQAYINALEWKVKQLKDLLGIFDRWASDSERVRVLLNLIGYQPEEGIPIPVKIIKETPGLERVLSP